MTKKKWPSQQSKPSSKNKIRRANLAKRWFVVDILPRCIAVVKNAKYKDPDQFGIFFIVKNSN